MILGYGTARDKGHKLYLGFTKVGHLKKVFAKKVVQLWKSPKLVEPPALKVFKSWCDEITADLIQNSR